ncbi:MAG: radical SAM protein [Desulfobacterales bacterium]|nr:radical SAM protein [Desulfobacterales bacterium]
MIRVALAYPNVYSVGMTNLGFQAVYYILNQCEGVVCERVFLSGLVPKNLSSFDIIAFSISFENDYPNLLTILDNSNIPFLSKDRNKSHPLILAGGVTTFLNPEPISPFIDVFLLGEAEVVLPEFLEVFNVKDERKLLLKSLAQNVDGIYVPSFYDVCYNDHGTVTSFSPFKDVKKIVKRVYLKEISNTPTQTKIVDSDTIFNDTFLVEVARGCSHNCRFCAAGYVYRPPRFRSFESISKSMEEGASLSTSIGLVGAAVSDLPDIDKLCEPFYQKGIRIAFSSLRADSIRCNIINMLKKSGAKTVTIAPDAGSERMRRVINKGITEDNILEAVDVLVINNILNLKLYFMIGLPTETIDDIDDIVKLCKSIKCKFLSASKTKGRIGEITVNINSFVPKPFTPFQWASMDNIKILKQKANRIKEGLKKIANIRIHLDIPRWAYVQALFSRGDRRVSDILVLSHKNNGNWPKTFKETSLNSDFYVLRERDVKEILPWDFIDNGINKSFLINEWQKAISEKTSPKCPMSSSCNICGVCNDNKER